MEAKLSTRKGATKYYVRLSWYDAFGRRHQTEVSTGISVENGNKRKAKLKMEEIREEYRQKYEVCKLIYTKEILFSDFMATWLENHKRNIRESTYQNYKKILEKYIKPYFAKLGVTLSDVSPLIIDNYYTYLIRNNLSANTVRRHHANIRKALQYAYQHNMIPANPADKVDLPKVKAYEAKTFTTEEINKILECVKGTPIEACVILGIYYGLRRSEICGLCWRDIDFEKDIIHIRNTRTRITTEVFEENTKSNTSNRILPLIPKVKEYLKKLYAEQQEYKDLFGNGYTDNDFVCRWQDGKPIACDYISSNFRSMLKKNNLPLIKFHSLRHSFATYLANSNEVSISTVQVMLGHSTLDMTRRYIHTDMSEKIKAGMVINELLEKKLG